MLPLERFYFYRAKCARWEQLLDDEASESDKFFKAVSSLAAKKK